MRTLFLAALCSMVSWVLPVSTGAQATELDTVTEPANAPIKLPNDPHFHANLEEDSWGQWQFYDMVNPDHSGDINLGQAWSIETGDGSVVIAFLDTGLRMDHEDIVDNLWENVDEKPSDANGDGAPGVKGKDDDGDGLVDEDSLGKQPGEEGYANDLADDDDENGYPDDIHGWDFVDEDNDPSDSLEQLGHGTLVAGFGAARGNNGIGIAGAVWNAKMMPLRTSSRSVFANAEDLAEALRYARTNGANIISMSLGVTDYDEEAAREIRTCFDAGIIMVAAAGNDGKQIIPLPNGDPRVITCGGCSINGEALEFPNCGSDINLVAPLVRPHTTFVLGRRSYYLKNADNQARGTSMAAPQVSAVAALVLSHRNRHPQLPRLTNRQVMALLYQTCDRIGERDYDTDGVPWDRRFGYGRVNAYAALTYRGEIDAFPEIENVVAKKREGSATLTYDLVDADGDFCDVKVEFRPAVMGMPPWKQNAPWKRGSVSQHSRTEGLTPRKGLTITWLASVDSVQDGQRYEVRLMPDDNKLFGISDSLVVSF